MGFLLLIDISYRLCTGFNSPIDYSHNEVLTLICLIKKMSNSEEKFISSLVVFNIFFFFFFVCLILL